MLFIKYVILIYYYQVIGIVTLYFPALLNNNVNKNEYFITIKVEVFTTRLL